MKNKLYKNEYNRVRFYIMQKKLASNFVGFKSYISVITVIDDTAVNVQQQTFY